MTDVIITLRQIQRVRLVSNLVYGIVGLNGTQSRERLDIKCDKAISELNILTEINRGDAQRLVTTVVAEDREQENREQENQQRAATRYISRGLCAFILTLFATVFAYHKL